MRADRPGQHEPGQDEEEADAREAVAEPGVVRQQFGVPHQVVAQDRKGSEGPQAGQPGQVAAGRRLLACDRLRQAAAHGAALPWAGAATTGTTPSGSQVGQRPGRTATIGPVAFHRMRSSGSTRGDRAPHVVDHVVAQGAAGPPVLAQDRCWCPSRRGQALAELARHLLLAAVDGVRDVQPTGPGADARDIVVAVVDHRERVRPERGLAREGRGSVEEVRRVAGVVGGGHRHHVQEVAEQHVIGLLAEEVGEPLATGEPELVAVEGDHPVGAGPPGPEGQVGVLLRLDVHGLAVTSDVHPGIGPRQPRQQLVGAVGRPVVGHQHVVDALVEQVLDDGTDDVALVAHRGHGPHLTWSPAVPRQIRQLGPAYGARQASPPPRVAELTRRPAELAELGAQAVVHRAVNPFVAGPRA